MGYGKGPHSPDMTNLGLGGTSGQPSDAQQGIIIC